MGQRRVSTGGECGCSESGADGDEDSGGGMDIIVDWLY